MRVSFRGRAKTTPLFSESWCAFVEVLLKILNKNFFDVCAWFKKKMISSINNKIYVSKRNDKISDVTKPRNLTFSKLLMDSILKITEFCRNIPVLALKSREKLIFTPSFLTRVCQ